MPNLPPGYFLTWHTYGTWLHGDDAGSVDREHNMYGSARLMPDPGRFARTRDRLNGTPLVLDRVARTLVDAIMREHCHRRGWSLPALKVLSNHVHAVIEAPTVPPEPIVKQLKEWGTRKLRSHRIVGVRQPVWEDHGSTIYLYEPGSLGGAVRYVLEMQDDPPEGHGRVNWAEKLGLRSPRREA